MNYLDLLLEIREIESSIRELKKVNLSRLEAIELSKDCDIEDKEYYDQSLDNSNHFYLPRVKQLSQKLILFAEKFEIEFNVERQKILGQLIILKQSNTFFYFENDILFVKCKVDAIPDNAKQIYSYEEAIKKFGQEKVDYTIAYYNFEV